MHGKRWHTGLQSLCSLEQQRQLLQHRLAGRELLQQHPLRYQQRHSLRWLQSFPLLLRKLLVGTVQRLE